MLASLRHNLLTSGALLLALGLSIVSVPTQLVWLWPSWLALVVIIGSLYEPRAYGLLSIWFVGFLLDFLLYTRLGEHALALVIVGFITIKTRRDLVNMELMRLSLAVFLLLMLYQTIILLIQLALAQYNFIWLYWLPAVSTTLLFILYMLLVPVQNSLAEVTQ
jgi:rod shape-determining protein MreD